MKRCRNNGLGYLLIIFGGAIILALLLPAKLMVYLLTAIIIFLGIVFLRSC